MAEDKPFDPTPSRLQKARREGNVAKSAEIGGFASFGLGVLAVFVLGSQIGSASSTWMRDASSGATPAPWFAALLLACVAGIYLASGLGGAVANIAQTKGVMFVAPKFQMSRLKPSDGFKRMFAPSSAISAAKAMLAFGCAIAIVVPTAKLVFVRGTGATEIGNFADLAQLGIQRVCGSVLLVAFLFAVADYIIVRKQWLKKLRMSLYELKKEMQENEGDPHLRGRRKQRHRSMIAGPVKDVAQAAFVVANPTHIAVALRYAPPEVGVPMVLCMGAEENALRIRTLASELGIPVIENVPLARELWASATVGRPIPRETFVAIAEIVTAICPPQRRAS